jgi:hypothetical protein
MMDKEHYYLLDQEAIPGKLEYYLSMPSKWACDLLCEEKNSHLLAKIGYLATGVFIGLLSLPFKGVAVALNRLYRKQIDPKIWEEEFTAWRQKFDYSIQADPTIDVDPKIQTFIVNRNDRFRNVNKLISQLIKLDVKAKDCQFAHIFLASLSKKDVNGTTIGRFVPSIFSNHQRIVNFNQFLINANESKKCLVIGYPRLSTESLELNDHFLRISTSQDRDANFKSFINKKFAEFQSVDNAILTDFTAIWLTQPLLSHGKIPSFLTKAV